jgi:hypothetical protein
MIARITRAKKGLAKYLRSGKKSTSKYTRDEKDIVTSLYGNIKELEYAENYLNKHKNYSDNYMHITLGFSQNDQGYLDSLNKNEQEKLLKQLVKDYISHHTSGYDIDHEVIAYAEMHYPKIKVDEYGNKRYNHIHIGISFLNPLSQTKLQTVFANSSFLDEVLVRYTNLKYNFEQPTILDKSISKQEELKDSNLNIVQDRNYWINELKNLNNVHELITHLKSKFNYEENIDFKIVNTNKNSYIKLIKKSIKNKKLTDINLRGKGFEKFDLKNVSSEKLTNLPNKKYTTKKEDLENLNQNRLKAILDDFYISRKKLISKRRSKEATQYLYNLKKQEEQTKEIIVQKLKSKNSYKNDYIKFTFQQKIFYRTYKVNIKKDLKTFFIQTKDDITTFTSKRKNISITDEGNKIVSNSKSKDRQSLEEKVSLMLDIATAKGWDVRLIQVSGSDEFKKEIYKQINSSLSLNDVQNLKLKKIKNRRNRS